MKPLDRFFASPPPLGMNRRNQLIRMWNSNACLDAAKDKIRSKKLLAAHGIAVARTYREIGDFRQIALIPSFPDTFVIKPNRGLGGNGILVLESRGERFVNPSGERYGVEDVRRHIRKILDGEYSGYLEADLVLLEERLYPAAGLKFRESVGLPDIRLFFYRGRAVMAMFRYPTRESRGRANLNQGAIGLGIDLESGRITHIHEKSQITAIGFDLLGVPAGFAIPKWGEIREVATRAAELSGLILAGVDMIVDDRERVMVLEINGRPGLEIQNINERSLLEGIDL